MSEHLCRTPRRAIAPEQARRIADAFLSAPRHVPTARTTAAYDELGQFVDALKMYAKAILLAPQDAELRNDLGLVYFNVGSYAEAIKAFNQALDIDAQSLRAHYYLGLVYLDLGDIQMAWAEHEQLIGRDEKNLAFHLLDKIQLQRRQAS